MKLVAGIQKGRRLKRPLSSTLRPTSSKVREALFAILRDHIANAAVLDLYAGTGAVGLEALSRGARKVVFVDHAAEALTVLHDNIQRCALQAKCSVMGQEVQQFLQAGPTKDESGPFDVIFADPPYYSDEIEAVLELLGRSPHLSSTGLLVLEHGSKQPVPQQPASLRRYRQARYGDTTLSFYSSSVALQGSTCG